MRSHRAKLLAVCLGAGVVGQCALAAPGSAQEPASIEAELQRVLEKAGIDAGLAVHIGTQSGELECALAESGRRLVHGLALHDAQRDVARQAILSRGLYGLASVATWRDPSRLPWASSIANLLVVDIEELAEAVPEASELERVVAPGGAIVEKRQGTWSLRTRPRPAALDDWGHFDHDARGTGASRDQLVDPVRQQQWLTELQPIPAKGNPAGYQPGVGVRIDGRWLLLDARDGFVLRDRISPRDSPRGSSAWVLQCRDAFNGVPIWTLPREAAVARRRNALVAESGRAWAWLEKDGELLAIDLAVGEIVRSFPGTVAPEAHADGESVCVRVAGEQLLVGLRERIVCFEASTAKQRWSFARSGMLTLAPVLDIERGRVYCVLAEPGRRRNFPGRWPASQGVRSVLALDLATGKALWECEDVASVVVREGKRGPEIRGIGQLIPAARHLIVFGSKAISGGSSPYLGAIDLKTGALAHGNDAPFQSSYNVWGYNVILRDGVAWFAGAFTNLWRYDPLSGDIDLVLRSSWNQRCTRLAATPRWFLFGQAAYWGADFSGVQVSVGRSGCALPNTPANGLTYFTPTMCGCTTLVRGFHAMTGERAPAEEPESSRRPSSSEAAGRLPPPALSTRREGPIVSDWTKQLRAGQRVLPPVLFGDLELHVVVHEHRVEARRGKERLWTFVADGRISSTPLIVDDRAVFGSHDGHVYCVDRDGRLRWSYLLAPSVRGIVVNSQIESSWPVYGVALSGEYVIASAGRHVELDGGIVVAAFAPATGELVWKKRLRKSPSLVPPGGKGARIIAHSVINSVLRIEAGEIVLGDGGRRGGEFRFSPEATEEEIRQDLEGGE